MSWITITRKKYYNGFETYGEAPKEKISTRATRIINKTKENIEKAEASAGFKSFKGWLDNANTHYNGPKKRY